MSDFSPSYHNYSEILHLIKQSGRYLDYADVSSETDAFVLLRHDIEFSVERAFKMALIEHQAGVNSSYFVQITNDSYNAFSSQNRSMLKEISEMGHKIGLHFHFNGLTDLVEIKKAVQFQASVLQDFLREPVDRFSFHRPIKKVLASNLDVDGLLNVYDQKFFTYVDPMKDGIPLEVKYVADSQHRWNYGAPNQALFDGWTKIHILVHPYSWTVAGYDNAENFKSLIAEKRIEFLNTLDMECKHFGEVRNEL